MNLQTSTPGLPCTDACDNAQMLPAVPQGPPRILVADAHAGDRFILAQALGRAGFAVTTAADGEMAWDALSCEDYDLLVTGNEMPRLPGLKLIERIRDANKSLPVILVSGSLCLEGVWNYAALDISAVIPKPFEIWELLTLVKIALRMSGEAKVSRYRTSRSFPPSPATTRPRHPVEASIMQTLGLPTRR